MTKRTHRARTGRRRRRRALVVSVTALGVAIVAIVGLLAASSTDRTAGSTQPEAFELPSLRGDDTVRLADYRGQPVVVNFFASWCSACDAELPGFSTISKELRGTVHFVGVASLETGDAFLMPRRHGITWWPLARDIRGAQRSGLHDALGGGNSMPLTAFYDDNGKLLEVERAAIPETTLRNKLNEHYDVDV